ncbi:MAG TPA: PHP domain-containing protein [Candidatus Limnocylindrales bacterium]|nr:PHP domain-containing protein [Candidatus Limnocylindrales bacterium]
MTDRATLERTDHPVSDLERLGQADLHIHTLASDGTAGVEEILEHVEHATALDVIAITDHERIDAAVAARELARRRGLGVEVVVGEEVTTLGGHLLALFIEAPIRPLRSLRWTIAAVHEQGGLAVPAHPLVPVPLCATGRALRRLLSDPDLTVHPDALEVLNPTTAGRPWHPRVVDFAARHGLPGLGNSDAHHPEQIGQARTTFPGCTAADLRAAIEAGTTGWQGDFYPPLAQVAMLGRQVRKYTRDVRDEVTGRLRRERTGRDLGYPGGRLRPPRFDPEAGR